MRKQEIRHKLREIADCLEIVSEELPSVYDEFIKLGLVKDGIYKKIEFALENIIDICNILNSELSLGVPSDEEDIIANLETNKIFSRKLIDKIREMKSFRNVLVHKHGKIDDEIAFDILSNNMADFEMFMKEAKKFISQ